MKTKSELKKILSLAKKEALKTIKTKEELGIGHTIIIMMH